jgi:hypothetical protein
VLVQLAEHFFSKLVLVILVVACYSAVVWVPPVMADVWVSMLVQVSALVVLVAQ